MEKGYFNSFYSVFNIVIAAICLIGIIGMYILEYFFHLRPCYLCYVQRILCAVIIVVFAFFLACRYCSSTKSNEKIGTHFSLSIINTVIIVIMNGVAWYQLGLEKHWITSKLRCASITPNDILNSGIALPTTMVRCDIPQYFMGLSVAIWTLLSLMTLLAVTVVYWIYRRKEKI